MGGEVGERRVREQGGGGFLDLDLDLCCFWASRAQVRQRVAVEGAEGDWASHLGLNSKTVSVWWAVWGVRGRVNNGVVRGGYFGSYRLPACRW